MFNSNNILLVKGRNGSANVTPVNTPLRKLALTGNISRLITSYFLEDTLILHLTLGCFS
jgi:hypothetical protein